MNIKLAACQALANKIEEAVPALAGKVFAVASDSEDETMFPSVRVLPGRFTFESSQEEHVDDDEYFDRGIFNVGCFEGSVEIRLSAKNAPERESYEQRILGLFLSREISPGVVVGETAPIELDGTQYLYAAPVAFELRSDEWDDEMAFDNNRFQYLEVDAQYPALVSREAFVLNSLVTAISNDLDATTPDESFQVNEDGSTSLA